MPNPNLQPNPNLPVQPSFADEPPAWMPERGIHYELMTAIVEELSRPIPEKQVLQYGPYAANPWAKVLFRTVDTLTQESSPSTIHWTIHALNQERARRKNPNGPRDIMGVSWLDEGSRKVGYIEYIRDAHSLDQAFTGQVSQGPVDDNTKAYWRRTGGMNLRLAHSQVYGVSAEELIEASQAIRRGGRDDNIMGLIRHYLTTQEEAFDPTDPAAVRRAQAQGIGKATVEAASGAARILSAGWLGQLRVRRRRDPEEPRDS
jgi:hypothetical protein